MLSRIIEKVRKKIRSIRFNVWLLEGKERSSGECLEITYVGHKLNKNYIANLIFDDKHTETSLGMHWIWRVKNFSRGGCHDSHLLIIEINEPQRNKFKNNGSFYIPCWIDNEITFFDATECLKRSSSLKDDLRRIRKHRFEYEISTEKDKFDYFYHHMYQPYIRKAHGNRAALMSYQAMMSRMQQSELLLIKQDEKYVAGEILVYETGGVRAWSLGLYQGDNALRKSGAVSAVYYYEIIYLMEKGFEKIDIGAARAFLKDGVLCFKKKWGSHLERARPFGFVVQPIAASDGLNAFYYNNPFIYLSEKEEFVGAVFIPRNEPLNEKSISDIYKKNFVKNMDRIEIYKSGGEISPVGIPPALADKIVIKSLDGFLNTTL